MRKRKKSFKLADLRATEDFLSDITGHLVEEAAMKTAEFRCRDQGVDITTEAGAEAVVTEFLAELGRRRSRVIEGFRRKVLCVNH